MNSSDPCVPWYFPISNNSTSRLCDPWEAREFRFHMSSIPYETCNYCLPDCTTTMYSSSVTAAPFRRCNYKNLGVSFLCNFEETIQPPIWSQGVYDQYSTEINQVPGYIYDSVKSSNYRNFADEKASGKQILTAANEANPQYDAYEKGNSLRSIDN